MPMKRSALLPSGVERLRTLARPSPQRVASSRVPGDFQPEWRGNRKPAVPLSQPISPSPILAALTGMHRHTAIRWIAYARRVGDAGESVPWATTSCPSKGLAEAGSWAVLPGGGGAGVVVGRWAAR